MKTITWRVWEWRAKLPPLAAQHPDLFHKIACRTEERNRFENVTLELTDREAALVENTPNDPAYMARVRPGG